MIDDNKKLVVFEDKKIRRIWYNDDWWFSVVDVVGALTDSDNPRNYWNMIKIRENEYSGIELYTNCVQLKLVAEDGKLRETDCANLEGMFRIIQSIPSKKAEPFKLWLARVGNERINEMHDPELTIDRAMKDYFRKGYSKEWINQRLKTIEVRKDLTDEWTRVGIEKDSDYAILTNEITKAWSGKTVGEYKDLKNIKKENLRDNMTNLEQVLNMLGEVTTTEISKVRNPKEFNESKSIAREGGEVAGDARKTIEKKLGKKVITNKNNLGLNESRLLKDK
ncbi:MAG: Bro-N domain-containing protein [archaeon]